MLHWFVFRIMSNGIFPGVAYKCFLMFLGFFCNVLFFSRTSLKLFCLRRSFLACGCVWVLFVYCWLLVHFRSGDPLRISSLMRKKTELWFKGSVGMRTAWFYWKWNSGIGLLVKHFYKIWANSCIWSSNWLSKLICSAIKPLYSKWGISHFGEWLGIYKKLNKLWIRKQPGRRPSH